MGNHTREKEQRRCVSRRGVGGKSPSDRQRQRCRVAVVEQQRPNGRTIRPKHNGPQCKNKHTQLHLHQTMTHRGMSAGKGLAVRPEGTPLEHRQPLAAPGGAVRTVHSALASAGAVVAPKSSLNACCRILKSPPPQKERRHAAQTIAARKVLFHSATVCTT